MTKRITIVPLGMLFSAGLAMAWPSLASAASCTISPQNPTVKVGGSVSWYATPKDISSPTYAWKFQEGTPSSSSNATQTVRYWKAGTFTTSLQLTRGDTKATCTTTVKVGSQDTTPPTVSLRSSPSGTLTPPATVDFTATASDTGGSGMSKVEFYDGATLKATDSTPSYTYRWSVTSADAGRHSWTAKAYDKAGNTSTSSALVLVVAGAGEVSINSTSANGTEPTTPVDEQLTEAESKLTSSPIDPNNNFTLLATNDLGMHCGDLDTRISSILPPFNVLHAQVVARGITTKPRILGQGEVTLEYSAASNPDDPAIAKVASGDALSSVVNGEVYKTNFWDIAVQAYNPFYPPGILTNLPADTGLPVPDVERFYLEDGQLHATQQAMPGFSNPYNANVPQPFREHFTNFPFFIKFPFGYVADNVNWHEAAGVPIAAFDDFGRENPYPLVRVQAKQGATKIASLDTVMPISGEANCQGCHAAQGTDGGNGEGTKNLSTVTTSIDDPLEGSVPLEVSVEWASDKNILKLHDQIHGTQLISGTKEDFPTSGSNPFKPVVCQRCHYTPALDLAQVGPRGPENDNPGEPGNPSNGRDQVKHKSMSNVMHSHHASTGLFPDMPPAIANGVRRNPETTQTILEQTCYSCHPGKRTQCMRGAMANGGLVCQDCHGQMAQVGDDFSRSVSPLNAGLDKFEVFPDFYINAATPRVPWANEPGCGSCHTGYATNNLAGTTGTLVNPTDTSGNRDGIRLLAAYRQGDAKATPIVPTNTAFAENVVTENDNPAAAGNPKLYRVSTGHGGVMCEGCHGATHAEWPNANPNANDNVAANQLQGHSGTVSECSTCHDTSRMDSRTQAGPHGMHLVNDSRWYGDSHESVAKAENGKDGGSCSACHGKDHNGTVLSRTPVARTFNVEGGTRTVKAGDPIGCGLCHSLSDSFER